MKLKYLFLSIFTLLIACSPSSNKKNIISDNASTIPVIDLDKGLKNISKTPFKCSAFIDDIEFIPLETTNESVIGSGKFAVDILPTPDFVYCNLKKFSLKDGKYHHLAGKLGRGPGEFPVATGSATNLVENRVFIFSSTLNKVLIYDDENNFIKEISIIPEIGSIDYLSEDNLILSRQMSLFLYSNSIPFEYQILNIKEGKIIYTREIDDLKKALLGKNFERFSSFGIGRNLNWSYDGKVRYYESFTDTIYTIEKDGTRVPRFFINREKSKPPFSEIIDNESLDKNRSKYITITSAFETPRFLFMNISRFKQSSYCARFDKLTQETKIVPLIGAFDNDLSIYRFGSLRNIPGLSSGIEYFDNPFLKNEFLTNMANIPKSEWKEPAKKLYELITKANPEDNGIICIYKFKN